MNPDEVLELARQAIAAGENPDDVARWLKDAGFDIEKMAAERDAQLRLASSGSAVGDFLHQAAEGVTLGQAQHLAGVGLPGLLRMMSAGGPAAAVGQAAATATSPEGQARSAAFEQRTSDLDLLAPDASRMAKAAPFANSAVRVLASGLGPAVSAIRSVASPLARRALEGSAMGGGGYATYRLFDKLFGR